ncbi:hypothetical protein EDD11_009292 [Mortierella claussenii]|nr:hypothetical protein EDD11_009292 [Mortierella claussenii]
MIFLRRSGSKYHLFPIINVTQFVNQLCIFFLITTSLGIISHNTALWMNVINNVAYFITKPTTMYLAYLRCSAVYPAFKKMEWLHYFLIIFRAIELFGIVVVNIIQNSWCNGSVAKGTRCEHLAVAWTFRDAGAPVFRFYYILCEGIFYVKLFKTLKGMSQGKNVQLIQYRRLQTTLFTVDLALLIFMSIYRIVGIFDETLPTYVYYELLSSTLTIFNLTEFGLNIRILFNTVTDAKTGDDSHASGNGPSRLEMGSFQHGNNGGTTTRLSSSGVHSSNDRGRGPERDMPTSPRAPFPITFERNNNRPMRHNSTSPLTSFAAETGYASDHDPATAVSSPRITDKNINASRVVQEYDDFVPYSTVGSPPTLNAYIARPSSSSSSSSSPPFQSRSPSSPVSSRHHPQDKHIISPSSFQSQAQDGFYEFSGLDGGPLSSPSSPSSPAAGSDKRNNVSKPGKAFVTPEQTTRRL